jgi:hypothetical protein
MLASDVTKANKPGVLVKGAPSVTAAAATQLTAPAWGEARWDEARWGGHPVAVTHPTGQAAWHGRCTARRRIP